VLQSLGSGVVVALQNAEGRPQIKNYLLTCAHVIRDAAGRGPIFNEILCWKPGRGYVRVPNRTRGDADQVAAALAEVHELSPSGLSPEGSQLEADDWALLEIQDPTFQAETPVALSTEELGEGKLTVIGYAGGAGLDNNRFWKNGHVVQPLAPTGFIPSLLNVTPGLIRYTGPDETRAGLSGGAVVDARGRLVGLHRSATDPTMERHGVSAAHIRRRLAERGFRPAREQAREVEHEPVPLPTSARPLPEVEDRKRPWRWGAAGLILLALVGGVLYLLFGRVAELQVTVRTMTKERGLGPGQRMPAEGLASSCGCL
jgi:hypothetical protein